MHQPKMQPNAQHCQPLRGRGFSLLELLVVISLLGLVAMASTTLLIDTGEEKRKDATEKNWDAIRKAIIGDSTQSLNGSPYLSGYVADMGRLPNNINELMVQGASQPDWAPIDINPSGTIEGLSGTLHGGWRGPYLYTAGRSTFPDGWVNPNDLDVNDMNFGWSVTLDSASPTHTAIFLQSLGEGHQVGGSDYGQDYPSGSGTLVGINDWQANVSSVEFNVHFSSVSATVAASPLVLSVYYIDDAALDAVPANFNFVGISGTNQYVTQQVSLITGGVGLPMGRYAAAILCASGTEVFDGNCDGSVSTSKQAFYFTLMPNTHQVSIPWNIP